jgi:hypothetical protein
MAQLHQRLTAVFRLQPLRLQVTVDFVLHRLARAGWRGNPALAAEVFLVIHRSGQGLPRYICKICSRLFLYGAMNQLQEFTFDDIVAVVEILEREGLMPLNSEQNGGVAEALPHLTALLRSQGRPVVERDHLCPQARLQSPPQGGAKPWERRSSDWQGNEWCVLHANAESIWDANQQAGLSPLNVFAS